MSEFIMHLPILSMLIWLPTLSAVVVLFFTREDQVNLVRWIGLVVSIISLVLCTWMWHLFDLHTAVMQFREHLSWIQVYNINYDLGVDGISMPMVVLTSYTTLLVVLASWTMVHKKVAQYIAAFLLMQGMVVGVFAALDAMLFYVFWEAMLIPMYLSIGIWGMENRSYAAIKFFLQLALSVWRLYFCPSINKNLLHSQS